MRALGWMLVLACLVAGVAAAHAEEATLDGMYASEGVNAAGKPYRGLVAIERHGENFIVRWIFARLKQDGEVVFEQSWIGVGIESGGVLAVSYYAPDDAGVVVYRIEKGGRTLIGLWAALGDVGAVSKETLTRLEEDVPMPPVELPPVTPEPAPVTPGPLRAPAGAAL